MPTTPSEDVALTEPMHLILLSLLDGDRHGYAIMQDVESITDGGVRMGPGTLYGAIKRLLQSKLIVEAEQRRDDGDDERRRYYRITALGRRVLDRHTAKLQRLVSFARRRTV